MSALGKGLRRQARPGVARKTAAKSTDKGKIRWPNLAGLGQGSACRRVRQHQTAACRNKAQPSPAKRGLQSWPTIRFGQSFRDEETKSNEEPLVDDFVTPRFSGVVAFDFQPQQIAQDCTGGFVPRLAKRHEPHPEGIVTMKKGLGHDRDLRSRS